MPCPATASNRVAGLRDDLLDPFRVDVRGIVADVDDVVLPVQPNIGDVWLLSQDPLDGTGATQTVHATERERVRSQASMLMIGCCHSLWIDFGHGGYLLLSSLRLLRICRPSR
jgi:hypothetical protein